MTSGRSQWLGKYSGGGSGSRKEEQGSTIQEMDAGHRRHFGCECESGKRTDKQWSFVGLAEKVTTFRKRPAAGRWILKHVTI